VLVVHGSQFPVALEQARLEQSKLAWTSTCPERLGSSSRLRRSKAHEVDVLDGAIRCAAELDQPIQARDDRFGLGHVLARTRQVVDRVRRTVQVPFAGLIQQLQSVFT